MSLVASRHAAGLLACRECGSARGAAVNTWNRNGLRRVGFSGPLRAGLIEAAGVVEELQPHVLGFPAPCGPASLKQLVTLEYRKFIETGFPAPCGPASLKQIGPEGGPRGPERFSGPLRAGLIEAGHQITSSRCEA